MKKNVGGKISYSKFKLQKEIFMSDKITVYEKPT